MKENQKMISVILGGGAGSRLYPLTEQRSKPAVPIGGKYRLIDIPISNCLNSNVRKMFVLTQYNSASLNQHIKNTYHFDSFTTGFVDILAAEQTKGNQEWFQGTADAVRQCMVHLENHNFEYLLILSGDQLYQMDFQEMVAKHKAQGADVTISTIPVNAKDATGFGIMKVNEEGVIDSFVEKPTTDKLAGWESEVSELNKKRGKVYLASMGIYIFSKAAIEKLFRDNDKADDFGKEIIPAAINSGYKVISYEYNGYWEDIGTVDSFFEANLNLADYVPHFNLFDEEEVIYTRPRMLPPSKFFGTVLDRALVAEGCVIEAERITRSVVGIRARIGKYCVIQESIIMGNDRFLTIEELDQENPLGIGERCIIENAIIDKDVAIGENVVIRGGVELEDVQEKDYWIRDGVVVVKKGAVIKAGTRIGLPKSKAL